MVRAALAFDPLSVDKKIAFLQHDISPDNMQRP